MNAAPDPKEPLETDADQDGEDEGQPENTSGGAILAPFIENPPEGTEPADDEELED